MLAIVHACAVMGIDGLPVEVQVDFNPRAMIPSFTIVGLPDSAVKESRERVRAAVKNSGQQFPSKAFVVNLSPADIPKHSTAYDLAIAVGVLAATDQIPLDSLEKAMFIGELSLDGRICHTRGIMPMAYAASQAGFETVFVPAEDAAQAGLIQGVQVIPVETLGQLVEHLYKLNLIAPFVADSTESDAGQPPIDDRVDFADIKGQEHVKRAIEIAAAGNHNIRLVGSPGCGKTLLARAMPTILPPLTLAEALEVTRIYSVADMLPAGYALLRHRPFQSPHHTVSRAGLVGGGSIPRPGAVSLSHRGILFLDEINEFPMNVLELLRQPMEDKAVTISRASGSLTFPAGFLLVAAHNPCPCGYFGDNTRPCNCTPVMVQRYQNRLSGPLLDRIDIHVDVPRVDYDKLMNSERSESSAVIRNRIKMARERQLERFKNSKGIFANGDMGASEVQQVCVLKPDARQLLDLTVRRMQLSARSYHRVLKLSRTIADLTGSDTIETQHVAEAVQYRPKQPMQ